ncbi:MAG: DUF5681 domain-containing protein [Candidatus Sphingomonas phytovorans]|nr:DUF5681 domain-containing protein [Sphingomonas sp.]WEK00481.1 MAG: DUF5681 domain-containing protein [Sphingomonas sp.]
MAERRVESSDGTEKAADGDVTEATGAEPAAYEVGKGKPPVGRRFAKGRSGNPRGRPKLRGGTGKPGDRLIGSDQPTRMMILEEAYRTITVRDGEEEVEIAANRAVFRAMMERALKGSRIAQRKWIEMVEQAESQQKRDQQVLYNTLELPTRKFVDRPGWGKAPDMKWSDEIVYDPNIGRTVIRRAEEEE